MFIHKINDESTYGLNINEDEFKTLKKVIDKLLFNPEGVSNYFKVTNKDVAIVNQIRTSLNGYR